MIEFISIVIITINLIRDKEVSDQIILLPAQLLIFLMILNSAINEKQFSIAVFIDAMKAFNMVDHEILLKKLKYYGIIGKTYEWIKNNLTERKQCTVAKYYCI